MTGFQPHPGLQKTAMGINEHDIDIERIAEGCGVKNIYKVDPYDIKQAEKIAHKSIEEDTPSVVIMERECAAISKTTKKFKIDAEKCTNCGLCYKKLGCPAIFLDNGTVCIADTCKGCSVCSQICPSGAIVEVEC
jgi:indolepyruvate ferredoxin oxidoreductase alpha subunit